MLSVICFVSFAFCYVVITRFMFLLLVVCCFLVLFVLLSIFCILCFCIVSPHVYSCPLAICVQVY